MSTPLSTPDAQNYRVVIEAAAWRQMMNLPRETQERILSAIENLETTARPAGCKKLEGTSGAYRIRINDYRVIYQIRDAELLILVVKIAHRRDVYR